MTVTVTCPQDGKTASDTVNIQVTARPVREFTFEDVHFDFDRYSLRPEATRTLDEAIATLQANPELNIEIEGHTCNIGTAEYNLALGERRANAVRDYLASRGIGANRLRTVSYGEERPKYDNSREETRRLNRRAALVVRLTRVANAKLDGKRKGTRDKDKDNAVHQRLPDWILHPRAWGAGGPLVWRSSSAHFRNMGRHRTRDRSRSGHHVVGIGR